MSCQAFPSGDRGGPIRLAAPVSLSGPRDLGLASAGLGSYRDRSPQAPTVAASGAGPTAPGGSGRYPPGITGTKGKTGVFGFSPGGNASGASTPLGPSERMYR